MHKQNLLPFLLKENARGEFLLFKKGFVYGTFHWQGMVRAQREKLRGPLSLSQVGQIQSTWDVGRESEIKEEKKRWT